MNVKIKRNNWTLDANLPFPVSDEKFLHYYKEFKNGNMEAKQKLIEHNLRLVSNVVRAKYKRFDQDELFSVGVIGLIKSIENFDISRGVAFSTYAVPMIIGEIKRFIRDSAKIPNVMSIEAPDPSKIGDKEVTLADQLHDDLDIALAYEQKAIYAILNDIVENLPDIYKEIVKHYFGFFDNIPKSQEEIARIINRSQAHVSRTLNQALKQVTLELYDMGLIDDYDLKIKEIYKEKSKIKKPKKTRTIYQLLKFYSKAQVDEMLTRLTEDERELIFLKYGEDLENPVRSDEWTYEHQKKFTILYRKMRYLLINPEIESTPVNKEIIKSKKLY